MKGKIVLMLELAKRKSTELISDFNSLYVQSETAAIPNITPSSIIMKSALNRLVPIPETKEKQSLTGIEKANQELARQFDYIQLLESANQELQRQLDTALLNANDAKVAHKRALVNTRELNANLEKQLENSMTNLKRLEMEHTNGIHLLEGELELMRMDLASVTKYAKEMEQEKKKILKEQMIERRENKSLKQSDQDLFNELHDRIVELEKKNSFLTSQNKLKEEKHEKQQEQLETLFDRCDELLQLLMTARETERAFEEQKHTIEELRLALENTQDQLLLAPDEPIKHDRLILTPEGWEWTPFLSNAASKLITADLVGLKNELVYLKDHRTEAFNRTKNQTLDTLGSLSSYIPFSSRFIKR
ncbi:hypothetical protein HDV01_000772 [Terramyces sp. JEL0728]|nr:hypothetical protein HDV01_000772 [Terramyces sp. JEL0728]